MRFGGLLFVLALLFSIGLHEFGHFITAKKFGMKVHEFFIGFGPKLFSVKRGETEVGVKILPFGGYVKIAGMNPFEEVPPEDADRVFKSKKPWKRAIVLAAGSTTHFLLAFVIIALIVMTVGEYDPDQPTTTVAAVTEEVDGAPSPAVAVGIREGDKILSVDGQAVKTWDEVVDLLHVRGGREVAITLVRDGKQLDVRPVLAEVERDGATIGFLGVGPRLALVKLAPIPAIGRAGETVAYGAWQSLKGLKEVFSPAAIVRLVKVATGKEERRVEDPATVVGLTGQANSLAGSGDFASFFFLIAAFNIFIGIANLLPLPPLDGGHLAVLAYEKIRGREVDVRRLIPISLAVITAFGSLFLLLLYLDIANPLPPIQ